MKLKKLFITAMAGILTMSNTLVFAPVVDAEESSEFDSSNYTSKVLFETTELTSNQTVDFEIDDEKLPKDKGKNGDLIQITYTEAGSSAGYLTLKFEALAPKTTSGEDVVSTKEYKSAQANKGKVIVNRFSFYEDLLAPATHTANTGNAGENATEAVTKIRLTFGSRMNFANKTVKIEVLTPKSADDSSTPDTSKPDDSSTPDTQSGTVYYQTKDNNSAIRFIDEVSIEDAKAATTASEETFVARNDGGDYQTNGKNAITKAYKSIIAGGQTVTAGDGKCYLISSAVSNLGNGDKVKAEFTLGDATNNKEVTISGAADSSKPDESSSKPDDSSSTTDPVITDTLWSGDKTLDDWSGELTINGNLSYWGKGTKITVNYEPVRSSQETVLQLVSRIGKNWTFTDIGYNEIHIPAGQKSYTIELSDDALASLKQDDCYAMTFKADNAVLKSVTITGPYSGPIKPDEANKWVKNDNGSYSFYWTNASAAPNVPAVSEKFAKIKIPIEGYKNSSITKITLEMQANGTVNGQFGVAQGESTGYKWTSTEYKFTGNATNTYELPVNGVSDGNSIELEIWWINKDTILSIKSITITGERL